MSQHTPGPWVMFRVPDAVGVTTDRSDVAHCHGFDSSRSRSEEEANARLIAKAPELLEVLEYFMPLIESEQDDGQQAPWVEKARIVMAEAKGEQQ